MTPVLQRRLPYDLHDPRLNRLPGMLPAEPGDWIRADEAFAGQMAERDRLLAERRAEVVAEEPGGPRASLELLETVLAVLAARPGYRVGRAAVDRPDGLRVALDRGAPMATLARLVQEDLCLLERQGDTHVLSAASLCFPAQWTLSEKLGRPLRGLHDPVPVYDEALARRVQRLFDALAPERPLWRINAHRHDDPQLYAPVSEAEVKPGPGEGRYLRSERQCLLRLPDSGAVVFSIHTYLLAAADVPAAPEDQRIAAT